LLLVLLLAYTFNDINAFLLTLLISSPRTAAFNNGMRFCLQILRPTRRARRRAVFYMVSLVMMYCNQTVFNYEVVRAKQLFLSVRAVYIISSIPIMKNS